MDILLAKLLQVSWLPGHCLVLIIQRSCALCLHTEGVGLEHFDTFKDSEVSLFKEKSGFDCLRLPLQRCI